MKRRIYQSELLQRYRAMMIRRKDFALCLLLLTLIITILFTPTLNTRTSFSSNCFSLSLFLALTLSLSPLCEKLPLIRLLLEISSLTVLILYSLISFYETDRIVEFLILTVTLLYFMSLMLLLLHQLFSKVPQKVKLLAALNFYLLTGISFSYLYLFINLLNPVAFELPDQTLANWPDYLYFSFVTLTTLGYGDILPVSELAQNLSSLEAVIGVLSPTVMIARFVSVSK